MKQYFQHTTPLLAILLSAMLLVVAGCYETTASTVDDTSRDEVTRTSPAAASTESDTAPIENDPEKATDTMTDTQPDKVVKTEAEWREILTPEQFRVARKAGTERAFTGDYWNEKSPGVYQCVACAQPLFDAQHKYDSGSGWPSYDRPIAAKAVTEHSDASLGMVRTEVVCSRCDSHLGHVFTDGPRDTTGLRYCINSASLKFIQENE